MMFHRSPSTAKLEAALVKAQSEFTVAKKDSVNPHFNSKYADMASVVNACKPALEKHGICISQWPVHSEDNKAHLITRLALGDEWMESQFSVPVSKQDPQAFKSAVTYMKRIMLEAVLCIASEDDDGHEASKGSKPHVPLNSVGRTHVSALVNAQERPEPFQKAPAIINYADKLQRPLDDGAPWPEPPNLAKDEMPSFLDDSSAQSAADYVVTFGAKFKGKRIGDIPKAELQSYLSYLAKDSAKTGRPVGAAAQELIDQCQLMWSVNHLEDSGIPF